MVVYKCRFCLEKVEGIWEIRDHIFTEHGIPWKDIRLGKHFKISEYPPGIREMLAGISFYSRSETLIWCWKRLSYIGKGVCIPERYSCSQWCGNGGICF